MQSVRRRKLSRVDGQGSHIGITGVVKDIPASDEHVFHPTRLRLVHSENDIVRAVLERGELNSQTLRIEGKLVEIQGGRQLARDPLAEPHSAVGRDVHILRALSGDAVLVYRMNIGIPDVSEPKAAVIHRFPPGLGRQAWVPPGQAEDEVDFEALFKLVDVHNVDEENADLNSNRIAIWIRSNPCQTLGHGAGICLLRRRECEQQSRRDQHQKCAQPHWRPRVRR